MELILASRSPRRRELLKKAGFEFTVQVAEVDESRRPAESAQDYVKRTAREKALAVARAVPAGVRVLGADTAVVTAGQILGKPRDAADAVRMLRLLSGGTHYVITGVCVARAPKKIEALEHFATTVIFKPLSEDEIERYAASGEPLDKAGAYAIQGQAAKFVERVEGSIENVIGLPVEEVAGILKALAQGSD